MGACSGVRLRRLLSAGVIGSLAVLATLLSSSVALAATTVGATSASPQACGAGFDTVQIASTGASYAAPGAGNLTDWSIQPAGTNVGPVGLDVWRGSGSTWTLVAVSPMMTLSGTGVNTFTLAAPIAVQAGDTLGLRFTGSTPCGQSTGNSADTYGWVRGGTAAAGSTMTFTQTGNFALNVSATFGTGSQPTPTPTPAPTATPTPTPAPTATPTPTPAPTATPTPTPAPTATPSPTPSTDPGRSGSSEGDEQDDARSHHHHNRGRHHHRDWLDNELGDTDLTDD